MAMDIDALLPPLPRGEQSRHVRPTDLSQFMRLRQCQRYLRFQLQGSRSVNSVFAQLGLLQQPMPPLLTRSGSRYEVAVEEAITRQFTTRNFGDERAARKSTRPDNPALLAILEALQPGERQILFQTRINISSPDGAWTMQGDVDLLDVRRDEAGQLHVLIADMKSSSLARVEHRLQVACYAEMLDALVVGTPNAFASINLGVLYRGEVANDTFATDEERRKREADRVRAREVYGLTSGCLEITDDPHLFRTEVRALIFERDSMADRIAELPFSAVPWSLGWQCDSCRYGPFCMREAAAADDLSLIPFLQPAEKSALKSCGVHTTEQLAQVRTPSVANPLVLVTPDDQRDTARALTSRSAVAHRLDEFVFRARRYQEWREQQASGARVVASTPVAANTDPDQFDATSGRVPGFIPNRGYPSLPASTPELHPNLVHIYIDAQFDYLQDRLYMVSALVTARENGEPQPERRRTILHHTGGPPDDMRERRLLTHLIHDVIVALNEVTTPNDEGERIAPIHLVFWEGRQQDLLLRALARHFEHLIEATPIYDFLTQIAAFDSSALTVLEREVRAHQNYPMVCQSLITVSGYLGFDWRTPKDFRRLFYARHFDIWQKLEHTDDGELLDNYWYHARARFNSSPPLEYAYHAWGELELGEDEQRLPGTRVNDFAVSLDDLCDYGRRRVEAIEHIAGRMRTNTWSTRPSFSIPDLAAFNAAAGSLADALQQFLTLERHAYLSGWRQTRQMTPEERMVAGATVIVRYVEADQDAGIAELNRMNQRKHALGEQLYADAKALLDDPDEKVELSPEDKARTKWEFGEHTYWLRVDVGDTDLTLEDVLPGLEAASEGEGYVFAPRWVVDSRLPAAEQEPHQPSYRQLALALRARRSQLRTLRGPDGRLTGLLIGLQLSSQFFPGEPGWVMKTMRAATVPLEPDALYTLDEDPNDFYGSHQVGLVAELQARGGQAALYQHLAALIDQGQTAGAVNWPPDAAAGQQRFLNGLRAMRDVDPLFHDFEAGKEEFIGQQGDAPLLLVQGPPGTGKSYTTGFAVFARLQGAMAADQPYRVILSCKTHSATDVLLYEMVKVQRRLADWQARYPTHFAAWFDQRLLEVPLGRIDSRVEVPPPIRSLQSRANKINDAAARIIERQAQWSISATPPAGVRNMLKKLGKDITGREFVELVVLDEASQMSLPEAIMASLPLHADGQLIVVGDHRQMAPIVQHNWTTERRRTFQDYEAYRSLFDTLRQHALPTIKFERSFRVHRDHAAFLRDAIYAQDNIHYHSQNTTQMRALVGADEVTTAILDPAYPLVVVVHDERDSQKDNAFEQALIQRAVHQLWLGNNLSLDPQEEIGIVVPHRAQRSGLQTKVPQLVIRNEDTGLVRISAVDTVERFQGDEREIIIVSATESDPEYLQQTTSFLLDPRRLTVAISRAKQKMILLASRTVFTLPIMDDETFMYAQIWRRLLRETCTILLWEGEIDGVRTQVWGNPPALETAPAAGGALAGAPVG